MICNLGRSFTFFLVNVTIKLHNNDCVIIILTLQCFLIKNFLLLSYTYWWILFFLFFIDHCCCWCCLLGLKRQLPVVSKRKQRRTTFVTVRDRAREVSPDLSRTKLCLKLRFTWGDICKRQREYCWTSDN